MKLNEIPPYPKNPYSLSGYLAKQAGIDFYIDLAYMAYKYKPMQEEFYVDWQKYTKLGVSDICLYEFKDIYAVI